MDREAIFSDFLDAALKPENARIAEFIFVRCILASFPLSCDF